MSTRVVMAAFASACLCAAAFAGYVTDGLLLRYDGIDNDGDGVHADAPAAWKDLSGNGYDMPLPSGAVTGENEVWFPSNVTATLEGIAALSAEANSNLTVEVVGYVDGDWTPVKKGRWDHGRLTVVKTSRLQFFFLHPHGEPGSIYNYHGTMFGATYTCYRASGKDWVRAWFALPESHREWNSVGFVKRPHTYSFRHSSSKYEVALDGGVYEGNGTRISDAAYGSLDSSLTLGASDIGFHFRALRIYTRHLTEAEMRQNAAEDALRFPQFEDCVPQCAKSVFSDALYWFNGARAGEFNNWTSMPNVVSAGYGRHLPGDPVYFYGNSPKTDVSVETMDVVCPYTRTIQKNRNAIRFLQPEWHDDTADTNKVNCTVLYNLVAGSFTNRSSYTVLARCKMESFVGPYSTLLRLNYGWSAERGMWLRFCSDGHVAVHNGTTGIEYKKMLNYGVTSFATNQWVDIAVTSGGGTNILYMCREGGPFISQKAVISPAATKGASDYRFYFGGSNENTGTQVSDNSQPFRGWISQLAVWGRELSETEVKAAFSDGCDDGDAWRVGVPTGDAGEFGGAATTVDLADQDAWLSMTNRLDGKGGRIELRFSTPDGRVNTARTLAITVTGASAASGAVDVTMNGASVAEGLVLAPGATATAAVPASLFLADGNVLEMVRTDEGGGPIEFDAFALSANRQDAVAVDAQRSDDDVFSSAAYWFVRPVDADSSGTLFDLMCSSLHSHEFRSVLQAAAPAHTNHVWKRWNGPNWDPLGTVNSHPTNYPIVNASVKCPYSGLELDEEPCLRFITKTEYVDDTPRGYYAGLQRHIFPVTNNVGHSGVMRLKLDRFMLPTNRSCVVVSPGYNWSNNNGLSVWLFADNDTDDMYVRINAGSSGVPIRAMLDYPEKDRIKIGRWMDLAYVMSNGYVRVYTCTEGGSLKVYGPEKFGDYSNYDKYPPDAERSNCYFGGSTAVNASKTDFGGFDGVFHSLALWPRPLSDDEVKAAMAWPRPDLVRIGVVNSSAAELPGGPNGAVIPHSGDFTSAPAAIPVGEPYEISFDVAADDAKKNQTLTLYTLPDAPDCEVEVYLNSRQVFSYAESGERIDSLSVGAGGKCTFGVHNSFLREGRNTLSIRRIDGGTHPVGLDALVFGNGGKRVRVRSRMGLTVTVQ